MAIVTRAAEPAYAPEDYEVFGQHQLEVTSRSHQYFKGMAEDWKDIALRSYTPGRDLSYVTTVNALHQSWARYYEGYKTELTIDRWKGGGIGGNTLPELHNSYIVPLEAEVTEQPASTGLPPMDDLLHDMLEESLTRVYPDELTLSDRIARLDANTRARIRQIILNAGVNQISEVDLAQQLEDFAGANDLCIDLDIGCVEKGITYQALRLARTEIKYMHSLVSQDIYRRLPFVHAYIWRISGNHVYPQNCACETRDGQTFQLNGPIPPAHSNCQCYTTAVLDDSKEFTTRLREWIDGGVDAELDQYSDWLGLRRKLAIFNPISYSLDQIINT